MSDSPIFDKLNAAHGYTDKMASLKKSTERYTHPLVSRVMPPTAPGTVRLQPHPILDGPAEFLGAQVFEGEDHSQDEEELVLRPFVPVQGVPRGEELLNGLDGVVADVRRTFEREYPGHVMTAVTGIQELPDGSAILTVEGQALTPIKPLSEKNSA